MALDADIANPGVVEKVRADQRETHTGKYGSVQTKPHKLPETKEDKAKKVHWIEIELVDKNDRPVPGETYLITLPDGETTAPGTLDEKGFARVEGIEPGTCRITFPNLEKQAWKPK
jgi:hypothetical protein